MIDTPMPLAETASIFNEQLLAHMVLKDASPDEQLSLLEGNLMETNQTIVDIYSRYLFETEVIDTRADHAMSVDELKDAMLRAQEASYGVHVGVQEPLLFVRLQLLQLPLCVRRAVRQGRVRAVSAKGRGVCAGLLPSAALLRFGHNCRRRRKRGD